MSFPSPSDPRLTRAPPSDARRDITTRNGGGGKLGNMEEQATESLVSHYGRASFGDLINSLVASLTRGTD